MLNLLGIITLSPGIGQQPIVDSITPTKITCAKVQPSFPSLSALYSFSVMQRANPGIRLIFEAGHCMTKPCVRPGWCFSPYMSEYDTSEAGGKGLPKASQVDVILPEQEAATSPEENSHKQHCRPESIPRAQPGDTR